MITWSRDIVSFLKFFKDPATGGIGAMFNCMNKRIIIHTVRINGKRIRIMHIKKYFCCVKKYEML